MLQAVQPGMQFFFGRRLQSGDAGTGTGAAQNLALQLADQGAEAARRQATHG